MPSPEELAREKIDPLLQQCGWVLQNRSTIIRAGALTEDKRLRFVSMDLEWGLRNCAAIRSAFVPVDI